MYLQAIVVLSLSIVQPFLCYEGVESSGNPIFEYLGIEPDSISEHELLEIDLSERSHKRGLGEGIPMNFQALGVDYRLWLERTDDTFISSRLEVFRAEPGSNHSVQYKPIQDAMRDIDRIWQDPINLASVILGSDDSGKTTVTAYLKSSVDNSPLTIRPLPAHVIREYMRKKRSIDDPSDDFIDSTYHVVLKLNNDKYKNHTMDVLDGVRAEERWTTDYNQAADDGDDDDDESIDYQNKVPTLYAEILVQTDNSFGFDVASRSGLNHALQYLLVFWNSVNLVYRQVEYPKIKLSVAGIIFGMDRESTPFIADNPLRGKYGEDGFNDGEALDASAVFYWEMGERFPFNRYDLIATMTTRRMGSTDDLYSLGIAYVGGTCKPAFTTIICDNRAFLGIPVAAHELGHLFTLEHDEGPEGSECARAKGYIMKPSLSSTDKGFTFSPCSLNALRANFTPSNFTCLKNIPEGRVPTVSIPLPGKFISVAKQCRRENKTSVPCDVIGQDDVCVAKKCAVPEEDGTISCKSFRAAIHGTPCIKVEDRTLGICLNYRCRSP